jgi:hypothetical protein
LLTRAKKLLVKRLSSFQYSKKFLLALLVPFKILQGKSFGAAAGYEAAKRQASH